ncbi:HipA domain-containing protein [Marinobacter salicampi]|uniref:HipA domain-containing protein n=1 Tax=Marinobacter salicampi TaxID=435907 RepID=UPI00140AF59B|nr:HipA domain-containing protein [Marinobacter salicampi]
MNLTLQIHWENEWHDAGTVRFDEPEKGLLGRPSFSYETQYTLKALERLGDFAMENLIDKTAVGVNLPCHFGGDYFNGEIAPVLRDIIPQGAGRRLWVKMMGYDRDPEQAIDTRLLAEGCVAPIGNLRIKEAADAFAKRLGKETHVHRFTREEVCRRADTLIEYAHNLGLAIGGATGAGGDAPKLLMVETKKGAFALEGTVADSEIKEHWLVKFPRGRKTEADIDVLKGEAAIYRTLEKRGFDSIPRTHLDESHGQYALWMPRFDREVVNGAVVRNGVESIYSLMGTVGNGSALYHTDILARLRQKTTRPEVKDALLADYLARDLLNYAVGNKDNHGRNTAIIKREKDIELSPAYDVAPMILDPEGIARMTRWPRQFQRDNGDPDYVGIIDAYAGDIGLAATLLGDHLVKLQNMVDDLRYFGAPEAMLEAPGLKLDLVGEVLADMDNLQRTDPAQR